MLFKKNYREDKEYRDSWYALTTNKLVMTLGGLEGEVNCDVCIIGAGFTGISTALELVERGYSVIVLEKDAIAGSASGKNGGQLLRGYSVPPGEMIARYGHDEARFMNNLSMEGLALILERINNLNIDCDLKFGHVTAATRDKHIKGFRDELKDWDELGHHDFTLLSKKETQEFVNSKIYIGGVYDQKGAHIHPLNYALGIAEAAQLKGVKFFENCPALEIVHGDKPKVITKQGVVNANYIFVAGAVQVKGVETIGDKSLDVAAHMLATEPLGEDVARRLITRDVAVADANFIMNYFRISSDWRLLFGGNCNYSNREYPGEDQRLRARMLKVFPGLRYARIDHCWYGPLNFTINRMPHLGRFNGNVFFAHGFGGHGVITTNILGKVVAEAIMGQAERFDVFERIRHLPFAGGDLFKRPLFVLGMTWYKLRDLL